jgi:uncharacterized protein (DUF486 family)
MPYLAPIVLLFASNVFMTFAWYGQLRFPTTALWVLIPVSWGIAFFEYCLAVPANRIGHQVYSAAQLKTLQEIITLLVFAVFSVLYLGETLRWNHRWRSCSCAAPPSSASTSGADAFSVSKRPEGGALSPLHRRGRALGFLPAFHGGRDAQIAVGIVVLWFCRACGGAGAAAGPGALPRPL